MLPLLFCSFVAFGQQDADFLASTIEIISDKIDAEGANAKYLKIRGWAFYSLDSLEAALQDYNAAIKMDVSDDDLYFRRGDVFFAMEKYNDAISDYSQAIKLSPDSLSYRISRAVAYEEIKEIDKAMGEYNYVLTRMPTNEFALKNRGLLRCEILNEFEKGLADFEKLLSNFPKARYFSDRGLLFVKKRKFELALNDFKNASIRDPNNELFQIRYTYCLGMIGKFTEALNSFNVLQQKDPNNSLVYRYRGEIFLEMGQKEKGCTDIVKAHSMGMDVDSLLIRCSKN